MNGTMNNKKVFKVPHGLPTETKFQNILKLNGLAVLETCESTYGREGRMFLQDHLLLFVLSGNYTVRYGEQLVTVKKNEMVLIEKAKVIEYQKSGDYMRGNLLNYWMFFLKDSLLKEFAKMANLTSEKATVAAPISLLPVTDRLLKYLESLTPYFNENKALDDNLIKLKFMELLYGLAAADSHLMNQLMQISHPVKTPNLADIMEDHVTTPASLSDLAYLSGRSLSSFKRDFHAMYHTTPSHWIRERRVSKAKELLVGSVLPITDICFMTGFESPAHFSRVFKKVTGYSPTYYRQNAAVVSSL